MVDAGRGDDGSIVGAFERAATDREHGATEIERVLLHDVLRRSGMADPGALGAGAQRLRVGQPAMANLRRLADIASRGEPEAFRSWAKARQERLLRLDEDLAAAAWPMISLRSRVVTVSRSSAVRACVQGAAERGWQGEVVVLDGGPEAHGRGLARELRSVGVTSWSQPDATAPRWLDEPGAVTLVGADAVSDRRFTNAVGTRLLLELTRARLLPSVLAYDAGKRVADEVLGAMVEVSRPDGDAEEDVSWCPFEVVPLALVDLHLEAG